MKKIKNFILSLVIPHRMVRFKDMSVFIAIVLLLLGFVISVFSSNSRMSTYAESEFVYGDYEKIIEEEVLLDNKLTFDQGKATYNKGVHNLTLNTDSLTYQVTMVFGDCEVTPVKENELYSNIFVKNFDFNDYINYNRLNREADTVYLLYVFTDASLYHVYDLGEAKIDGKYVNNGDLRFATKTVTDENANLFSNLIGTNTKDETIYYLPNSVEELVLSSYDNTNYQLNTSKWTKHENVKEGDTADFEIDGTTVTVHAMPVLGAASQTGVYGGVNFVAVYGNVYTDLMDASIKVSRNKYDAFNINVFSTSLKTFVEHHHDARVFIKQDDYKTMLMFIALIVFLIIPVVFVLFVWLFTRKRGMTKYKSYLNIMSIIQFAVSLLFFTVGWFVNLLDYIILIFAGLLMMLWYYIFVIYRITTVIEQENNENNNNNRQIEEQKTPEKVVFKKLDDDSSIIG